MQSDDEPMYEMIRFFYNDLKEKFEVVDLIRASYKLFKGHMDDIEIKEFVEYLIEDMRGAE